MKSVITSTDLPDLTDGVEVAVLGLAWVDSGRKGSPPLGFVDRVPALRALFAERWYLDHVYRRIVDQVVDRFFSNLCARNDRKVIDGSIDGFCKFTVGSGRVLSLLQSGLLRNNLMLMFAVLALVALFFFFW